MGFTLTRNKALLFSAAFLVLFQAGQAIPSAKATEVLNQVETQRFSYLHYSKELSPIKDVLRRQVKLLDLWKTRGSLGAVTAAAESMNRLIDQDGLYKSQQISTEVYRDFLAHEANLLSQIKEERKRDPKIRRNPKLLAQAIQGLQFRSLSKQAIGYIQLHLNPKSDCQVDLYGIHALCLLGGSLAVGNKTLPSGETKKILCAGSTVGFAAAVGGLSIHTQVEESEKYIPSQYPGVEAYCGVGGYSDSSETRVGVGFGIGVFNAMKIVSESNRSFDYEVIGKLLGIFGVN